MEVREVTAGLCSFQSLCISHTKKKSSRLALSLRIFRQLWMEIIWNLRPWFRFHLMIPVPSRSRTALINSVTDSIHTSQCTTLPSYSIFCCETGFNSRNTFQYLVFQYSVLFTLANTRNISLTEINVRYIISSHTLTADSHISFLILKI